MDSHRISRAPQPIACTLTSAEAVDRTAEWSDALARAEHRERTADGVSLTFPPQPELAARLADLAAREADCCAFFTFTLGVSNDALRLHVSAPADGQGVVTALFG